VDATTAEQIRDFYLAQDLVQGKRKTKKKSTRSPKSKATLRRMRKTTFSGFLESLGRIWCDKSAYQHGIPPRLYVSRRGGHTLAYAALWPKSTSFAMHSSAKNVVMRSLGSGGAAASSLNNLKSQARLGKPSCGRFMSKGVRRSRPRFIGMKYRNPTVLLLGLLAIGIGDTRFKLS